MITTPGFYPNLRREQYHADPCAEPSLSSGTARRMLSRSPLHAWTAHPRLNPNFEESDDASDVAEIGSAIHALIVRDPRREVVVVEAEDWRKKEARKARDDARAEGKIALLAEQFGRVKLAVDTARKRLKEHEIGDVFADDAADRELCGIWQEPTKRWCRMLLDFAPKPTKGKAAIVYDVKTTNGSADPVVWARRLYEEHGDLQAAFYARGFARLTGIEEVRFRFVTIEQRPPFAISVTELEPASLAMANRKVERALMLWDACLSENHWPGYPSNICHLEAPAYAERAWLELEERAPLDPQTLRDAFWMQRPITIA